MGPLVLPAFGRTGIPQLIEGIIKSVKHTNAGNSLPVIETF